MERDYWIPENPIEEPVINLTMDGEPGYELNRLNTTLHTFLGRLAVYNHVFYTDIHEEEVQESFYIFNFEPSYPQIEEYMRENDFTQVLNQTEVSSGDIRAYIRASTRDLGDTIPENWGL